MGLSHTVSGSIASFRAPSRVPIESLKFHFLPKQASGTPTLQNPIPIEGWTGLNGKRTGKNLLNPFTNPIWLYSQVYTINSDGSVTISGSDGRGWATNQMAPVLLPKGTYTLRWDGSPRLQFATSNDSYAETTSYNFQSVQGHITFTLNQDGGIKWKHTANAGDYPLTCHVQIEPGLIAHEYESYSGEVIPITFPSNGKNIINWPNPDSFSVVSDNFNGYNSTWIPGGYRVDASNFGKKLTYSATLDNTNGIKNVYLHIWVKDADNKYISINPISESVSVGQSKRVSITIELKYENWYDIFFGLTIATGTIVKNPMVEYGDTATDYVPYTSDNAFYGGYYDPAAGEIVAEYFCLNTTWGAGDNNTSFENNERRSYKLVGPTPSGSEALYQKCNVTTYGYDFQSDYTHVYCAINGYGYLFLPIGTSDDTVVQILYRVADPIHIPVPIQVMKAYLDYNNFWSDANGITEVTYAVTESKDILATRKMAAMFNIGDYVKDGLILWMDGLDKGNVPGAWVDKVDGHVFTNVNGMTIGRNYIQFTRTSEQLLENNTFDGIEYRVGTVEVVISDYDPYAAMVFTSSMLRGICFGFGTGGGIIYGISEPNDGSYMNHIMVLNPDLGGKCFSINYSNAIIDGQIPSFSSNSSYFGQDYPAYSHIGGRIYHSGSSSLPNYFDGKIHAIRVYNRHLSTAEMLHNQKIDNQRFKLGLNI